jgi:hypothetical protein
MADTTKGYLRYLRNRQNLAAMFRVRAATALGDVNDAEKMLAAVAAMDDSGWEGDADIGPDADDALAEFHVAAAHLRNVLRIAIGHERDIRDEITAAEKEASGGE